MGNTILIVFLLVSFTVSYLLGSLNFAIIVTKLLGKGDIRDYGSGNAGMTNVLRTVGKKAAAFTLLGDFLKGYMSVTLVRVIFNIFFAVTSTENVFYSVDDFFFVLAEFLAFYGSFLGHLFPIYYKFKGGKGVVVSFGALMVLSPLTGLICAASLIITVAITKYMSVGSILCAIILPIGIGVKSIGQEQQLAQIILALPVTISVIYMHKENIKRLINKTENKVSLSKKKDEVSTES